DAERGKQLLKELAELPEGFTMAERASLLDGLARVAFRQRWWPEARTLWERAANLQPNQLVYWLALADLAERQQDDEEFSRLLKQIRRIEGDDGPNGCFLEAIHLLARMQTPVNSAPGTANTEGVLDRARRLLLTAAERRPFWPAVARALGDIATLSGNRREAIQHYRRALSLGDRSQTTAARLVEALYREKRFVEADQTLRQVSALDPTLVTGDMARLAWRVAWQQHRYDLALSLAADVAQKSRNFLDLIWLSRLRFARGKRGKEVEDPLRQAVQLAPKEPATWFALIAYLVRVDQTEEAKQVMQQAAGRLPDRPAFLKPVALAQYSELLGETSQARQYYEQAFQTNPKDVRLRLVLADFLTRIGEFADAEPHLDALLDPASGAPEFAVAWARRRKARTIAASGRYDDTMEALALLDAAKEAGNKPEDLRAKVAVLARRDTWREQRMLIDVLDQIRNQGSLTNEERVLLGQALLRTGQRSRAVGALRSALRADPRNTRVMSLLVRALLDQPEPPDSDLMLAESVTNQLQDLQPGSLAALEASVRLLVARGRSPEAAKQIQDYVQKNEGKAVPFRTLARLSAELKLRKTAESLLQQGWKVTQQTSLLFDWIRFLGSEGRTQEALDLCETARKRPESSDRSLLLATAALAQSEPSDEQINRVSKWIAESLQAHPQAPEVLLAAAEIALLQRQLAQAEISYRRLLEQKSENIVAKNNLAWTLALQKKDLDEGLRLIDGAIEAVGPRGALLDTRGLVLLAMGRTDEAISVLEEAVADWAQPSLYVHLAQAYVKKGDTQKAIEAVQAARKLGLKEQRLHPLERAGYRRLLATLGTET
ncbi:MAG: tetratricopeptide repeat protein, partial [Planctomycetes bacterium]|nr:tetratricopeptide repeat protein [Planctomycetota bacterium]